MALVGDDEEASLTELIISMQKMSEMRWNKKKKKNILQTCNLGKIYS